MFRSLCVILALGLLVLAAPSSARAGVDWSINIDVPVRVPRLALIEPDIHVVEGVDAEIFFAEGRYWTRRNGYWYCARRHRGNFHRAGDIRVPWRLNKIEHGRYRNYSRRNRRGGSRGNSSWGHQRGNDDRKDDRKDRKDDRKDRKRERKEQRNERRGNGRH